MKALAIGIALIWLIVTLRGKSYTVKGIGSILFMLLISYGLGSVVLLAFNR